MVADVSKEEQKMSKKAKREPQVRIFEVETCEQCGHCDADWRLVNPHSCRELGRVLRSPTLTPPRDCPLPTKRQYIADETSEMVKKLTRTLCGY